MAELKVKSKKYNDADVLEMKDADLKSAVEQSGFSGGTQLYKHIVSVGIEGSWSVELLIISTKSTSYTLADFAQTEEQDGLRVPVSALVMGYRNAEEEAPYQNCDSAIISNTQDGLKVLFGFNGSDIADYSDVELTTKNIDTFIDNFQPY